MVLRAIPTLLLRQSDLQVLSLDLFDTLLLRPAGAELQWMRQWAQEVSRKLSMPPDVLLAARRRAWGPAIQASGAGRPDPEPTHRSLLAETLRLAGFGSRTDEQLLQLVTALELEAIVAWTTPNPAAIRLLDRAHKLGMRRVLASDMYLSAVSLSHLLERHGLQGFSRIYVSSEEGRTKFSGRLFDRLLQQEGVPASRVLHVGDHPWSDGIAPASRGIRSRWIGPPSMPRFLRTGLLSRSLEHMCEDPAKHLGRQVLGPALMAALPLLRQRLEALAPDLVLYVARDGELLFQLMDAAGPQPACPISYGLLSRRSTLSSSLQLLDLDTAVELLSLRRSNRGLLTLFGGLGMDPKTFALDASEAGFDSLDEPIANPARDLRLARLLKSEVFQDRFAADATRQHCLLRAYLAGLGYFAAGRVVLIDLGWRGSIQDALTAAFVDDPNRPELHGVYLGLWDDGLLGDRRCLANKHGLLADPRRGRHPLEAALPELGLALEPIFRAAHGTVTGYRKVGDRVEVVFDNDPLRRRHEQSRRADVEAIRQGLINACRRPGATGHRIWPLCLHRFMAQTHLVRLAYFPTRQEIRVLGGLPVSEGSEPQWSLPAIIEVAQNQFTSWPEAVRDWARGLESPWRAGYIVSTAGMVGAMAYFLAQLIWLPLPAPIKRLVRRTLQRMVYRASR